MIFLLLAILAWGYVVYLHFHYKRKPASTFYQERTKFLEYMDRLEIEVDEDLLKDYTCTSDFVEANRKLKKIFKKHKIWKTLCTTQKNILK